MKGKARGQNWHYLRFPNLAAGTGERHDQAMAWLKSKGYREADISTAFGDWEYTDAYARCVAKGDAGSIEEMKTEYLRGVDLGIVNMKAVSLGGNSVMTRTAHAKGISLSDIPAAPSASDVKNFCRQVKLRAEEELPIVLTPARSPVKEREQATSTGSPR